MAHGRQGGDAFYIGNAAIKGSTPLSISWRGAPRNRIAQRSELEPDKDRATWAGYHASATHEATTINRDLFK
jgi:hypothetical protein